MTRTPPSRIAHAILVFSLCFGIPSALAVPTWSNYMYLSNIEVSNGTLYLSHPDLSTCLGQAAIALVDANGSREIYATAVAAFIAGRPVRLLLDGCAGYYVLKGITF